MENRLLKHYKRQSGVHVQSRAAHAAEANILLAATKTNSLPRRNAEFLSTVGFSEACTENASDAGNCMGSMYCFCFCFFDLVPGILITLVLEEEKKKELIELPDESPTEYYNNLAEQIASFLAISGLDVIVWWATPVCSYLEVTVPARAASLLKHIVPNPPDPLKKLGVISASIGEENAMEEGRSIFLEF